MSIATYTKDSGVVRRSRKIFVKVGGVVVSLRSVWIKENGVVKKVFVRGFTVTISSNTANFSASDVTNGLTAAGWNGTDPIDATLVLASGIFCRATSTAAAGLITPSLPLGSTLTITNLGKFQGKGGAGGSGDLGSGPQAGFTGGPAISLGMDVTIDNGSGFILGGGGGGGGGSRRDDTCGSGKSQTDCTSFGGGGGGGAGTGAGGTGVNNGAAGTNVNTSGANGAGGQGVVSGCCSNNLSGNGGNGGDWGAAGSAGGNATVTGGAGGAAGKAIQLNGFTATFLSGNDGTHVKGAVS